MRPETTSLETTPQETKLGAGLHRGVPMAVYHGDCCPGPSVSASVLVEMRDGEGCPAKALARHYLSPWLNLDHGKATTARPRARPSLRHRRMPI